jgi:hypothetical protein
MVHVTPIGTINRHGTNGTNPLFLCLIHFFAIYEGTLHGSEFSSILVSFSYSVQVHSPPCPNLQMNSIVCGLFFIYSMCLFHVQGSISGFVCT